MNVEPIDPVFGLTLAAILWAVVIAQTIRARRRGNR